MPKLNREYRQAGAESMFAAAYRQAKLAGEPSMSVSVPGSPPRSAAHRSAGAAGTTNSFFITGGGAETGLGDPETSAVEDMAADVMDQVRD